MAEAETKKISVTFHEGVLPGGTHATFKVGNQHWTAWPNTKHAAHLAVCDRLIGVLHSVRAEATRWLSNNPGDVKRAGMLLAIIARSDEQARALAVAKTEVRTS